MQTPAGSPGLIVVLNGVPRSGKSSIAAVLEETFPGVWVNLGVDRYKPMVPDRYQPGIGLRPGGKLVARCREPAGDLRSGGRYLSPQPTGVRRSDLSAPAEWCATNGIFAARGTGMSVKGRGSAFTSNALATAWCMLLMFHLAMGAAATTLPSTATRPKVA
jgi:Chloramphenicol phosphotransferase-like protein